MKVYVAGMILGVGSLNEGRRNNIMSSLNRRSDTRSDPRVEG